VVTTDVTPRLVLGDVPASGSAQRASTARKAAAIILAGGTAVLPAGAWDKAEATLRLLTMNESVIRLVMWHARSRSGD
jgi:hypothetical protein